MVRTLIIAGAVVLFAGLVAVYVGGIQADETQTTGNAALWLIPAVGVAVLLAGIIKRQTGRVHTDLG